LACSTAWRGAGATTLNQEDSNRSREVNWSTLFVMELTSFLDFQLIFDDQQIDA